MRWEDERYVRIYTRDTPDWLAMQWQGRAVFYELSRKVDRAGFVPTGKSGNRGLAGCLHMPIDVVEVGIEELLTDGCVVRVDGGLLIRNFLEAQETRQSDAARKRSQRERDRDTKRATADDGGRDVTDRGETGRPVTVRDHASQNVTDSHELSPAVTDGHSVPCRTVPTRTEPDSPPSAPAREPMAKDDGLPAIATDETLLAAVAKHPMLAELHGDRRWAQNASSGFMAAAVLAVDVDAAVVAFVTGEAAAAPEHPEALATWVRANVGRYLKKAKQYGDDDRARAERDASRRRERPSEPRGADAQAVLETFGPVWAAKKRRPFVPATTDERHAAEVASRAQTAAPAGMPWLDVVRHWSEQHLASADRLVVESDHALRTLGMNLTSYGLPKPARQKPAAAPEEPIVGTPMPPGMLDAIGAQGPRDGVAVRRPRLP